MKIYLDLVLFLNIAFDFILLFIVSLLLKRRVKIKRIFLGSLVGGLSILFLFLPLNSFTLFIGKVIVSILMILTTFGFHSIKIFLKNISYLYFVSIIQGGFLYFLNIQFSYQNKGIVFFHQGLSINAIFLIVISPIILYFYYKDRRETIFLESVSHTLDIYVSESEIYSLNAYMDTGNQVYDPYFHRPIILVSILELEPSFEEAIIVPYQTLEGSGILKCRKVKKIVIDKKHIFSNVLVAPTKTSFHLNGCEAILPPEFFK